MSGSSGFYRWQGDELLLRVRVQPRASRDAIVGPQQDSLKVRLTAPPVDGQANAHLIRLLADAFKVAPSQVTLVSGERGRAKHVRIASPRALPPYIAPHS